MTKVDVVVTGATGNVGSQLVRALAQRGDFKVRALVRNTAKARETAGAGVELVEAARRGDVVICTQLQCAHHHRVVPLGAEHDDRGRGVDA